MVKKKKKDVGQLIRSLHKVEEFLDWDFRVSELGSEPSNTRRSLRVLCIRV